VCGAVGSLIVGSGATPRRRVTMASRLLLASGIAAPLLYAVADGVSGSRRPGYSFLHQTISELGAIGAPSRPLFAALLFVVYGLMVAFGLGVWMEAGRNRRLRTAGTLIVTLGVLALTAGQLAAMRMRGAEQGLAGTMHLLEGAVAMSITFSAMGIAAAALGQRFRRYTVVTIVLCVVFGAWSLVAIPQIDLGLATPWLGLKERVFWYGHQSWFAVLALTLLRRLDKSSLEPRPLSL
jgi:hypothetical membrane protein